MSYTVGQQVAIERVGSWSLHFEGEGIVSKVNKQSVYVDMIEGEQRKFSIVTGRELKTPNRQYVSEKTYIIGVEVSRTRREKERLQRDVQLRYRSIEQAAKDQNFEELQSNMELLKKEIELYNKYLGK